MERSVTLDADVAEIVGRLMARRGVSFDVALNDAIRAGSSPQAGHLSDFTTPKDLGVPRVDVNRTLVLAGDLEDAEIAQARGLVRRP